MNIHSIDYKCYDFSINSKEYESILWEKANSMVDSRLHGNLRKGAIFEAYIYLSIEYIIRTYGLQTKLKVSHNPYTYRRYFSRKGKGIDIMIYQKKRWNWKPIISIEVKNWAKRYLSPKQFKTHILRRFNNIVGTTKLLITKGIKYGKRVTQLLHLNQIHHIQNNSISQLKQLINKMYSNNMSKNVQLHKTQNNNNHISSLVEDSHPILSDKQEGEYSFEKG